MTSFSRTLPSTIALFLSLDLVLSVGRAESTLDVVEHGAVPNDGVDDRSAFN